MAPWNKTQHHPAPPYDDDVSEGLSANPVFSENGSLQTKQRFLYPLLSIASWLRIFIARHL
jgi:hypothetical protein